ncbi:unnamed protein product [Effrenium voratum]|uniref:Uncharacterized protein n=1 Tax=Effrenium voratum TaxID=2562239 RepID=A0AA36NH55_9DINO|nr:unnamed protein product [Effrenium voratum]
MERHLADCVRSGDLKRMEEEAEDEDAEVEPWEDSEVFEEWGHKGSDIADANPQEIEQESAKASRVTIAIKEAIKSVKHIRFTADEAYSTGRLGRVKVCARGLLYSYVTKETECVYVQVDETEIADVLHVVFLILGGHLGSTVLEKDAKLDYDVNCPDERAGEASAGDASHLRFRDRKDPRLDPPKGRRERCTVEQLSLGDL